MALRLAPLVGAASQGDASAFEHLVGETRGVVCAIALAITRDVHASEDVAQDVYLHAWRSLPTLRNSLSFLPWLRQLTRHRARMAVRASSRRRRREVDRPREEEIAAMADPAPDALRQLLDSESRALLREALAAVPDGVREVLVLFYREGQSVRQVAALLDLTEMAVRQRLARARTTLRKEYLAQAGDTLGRTAPGALFVTGVASALLGSVTPSSAVAATAAAPTLAATTAAALASTGGSGLAKPVGGAVLTSAATSVLGAGVTGAAVMVASTLVGLVAGVAGVAIDVFRRLRATSSPSERQAIRRYGVCFVAGMLAFAVLSALTPSLQTITIGYAALALLGIYLQWVFHPQMSRRPVRRDWLGLMYGVTVGALPLGWFWWQRLSG